MNEISMTIYDLVMNSLVVNSTVVKITIRVSVSLNIFEIIIEDDGDGISKDRLATINDPFSTSRTTRKVGMGISLFEMDCLQAGGRFEIDSRLGTGTRVEGSYKLDHIDRPPLGNIVDTIFLLSIYDEKIDIVYNFVFEENKYTYDTKEIKEVLDGVSLSTFEVMKWIKDNIYNGMNEVKNKEVIL